MTELRPSHPGDVLPAHGVLWRRSTRSRITVERLQGVVRLRTPFEGEGLALHACYLALWITCIFIHKAVHKSSAKVASCGGRYRTVSCGCNSGEERGAARVHYTEDFAIIVCRILFTSLWSTFYAPLEEATVPPNKRENRCANGLSLFLLLRLSPPLMPTIPPVGETEKMNLPARKSPARG